MITTDWRFYDHITAVFKPKNMTPYELQMGRFNAKKRFYSISSVLKRSLGNLYSSVIYFSMNYGYMKEVKVDSKRMAKLKSELFERDTART